MFVDGCLFYLVTQAATENFDKLRDKYKEKVDSLTGLVDEATDAVEFIKASGERVVGYDL